MWDIENELPDELIESSIDPDLPQPTPATQNLYNGTSDTVPVEGSVAPSPQRHQQLSQLLQAKPQSHTGLPARIPSPSVTSITSVKSPLTNNATVNKSVTPVSSTAHINVSDGNIAITNISNSTVNSLSNTSGTMGMNSNMLLMQKGTLGSQGSLVSLSTSVAGNSNTGSLQHPVAVVPQLAQQQNAGTLINGTMSLGSSSNPSSLSINRSMNPNVSSAVPHQNILGHPLTNQGANLKVCIILLMHNFKPMLLVPVFHFVSFFH